MKSTKTLIVAFCALIAVSMAAPAQAASKTYLVNGIASAVPFIGFGLNNLSKKARGAKLFSYITAAEGNGPIKRGILRDIRRAHARNPNVKVNLVGISQGAKIVTSIANTLAKEGIPVNYLGVIEGGSSMPSIKENVRTVDNFICSNSDCTRGPVRLSGGNSKTKLRVFDVKSSHIPMGNHSTVHNRVLRMIR